TAQLLSGGNGPGGRHRHAQAFAIGARRSMTRDIGPSIPTLRRAWLREIGIQHLWLTGPQRPAPESAAGSAVIQEHEAAGSLPVTDGAREQVTASSATTASSAATVSSTHVRHLPLFGHVYGAKS